MGSAGPLCGAKAALDTQSDCRESAKSPSSPAVGSRSRAPGAQLTLQSRRPGPPQGLSISFCETSVRSVGSQLLMRRGL